MLFRSQQATFRTGGIDDPFLERFPAIGRPWDGPLGFTGEEDMGPGVGHGRQGGIHCMKLERLVSCFDESRRPAEGILLTGNNKWMS